MARWKPKAAPRISGAVTSAMSASRGEVRTPFPTRSAKRSASTAGQAPARPMSGRATEESP